MTSSPEAVNGPQQTGSRDMLHLSDYRIEELHGSLLLR